MQFAPDSGKLLGICTNLWNPFLRSFPFILGKQKLTDHACAQALLAVKTATTIAIVFGVIQAAIALNHAAQLASFDPDALRVGITLATVALFYPLFFYMILLPNQVALKKQLSQQSGSCA